MISPNGIAAFPSYDPESDFQPKIRVRGRTVPQNLIRRSAGREYSKISRLLVAMEFIAIHRLGVTVEMVHEHLNDQFGTGERTSRRDVARLVACGFVVADYSQGFTKLTIDRSKLLPRLLNQEGK